MIILDEEHDSSFKQSQLLPTYHARTVANQEATSPAIRTPLYELIAQQTSKFTPFAGWEMPIQFSGLKIEHNAVRNGVGMFDISHMGKFILTGDNLVQCKGNRLRLSMMVSKPFSRM